MIHGLIEGRLCHYINESGEILAADIVAVVDRGQAIVNLHVKSRVSAEIAFREKVPYQPLGRNVRGSWHYIPKID